MNINTLLLTLIAALAVSYNCSAQDSVEDIANQYFTTLQAEGMTSVGKYMHPDALVNFKEMLLPIYKGEAETGKRQLLDVTFGKDSTVDDLESLDPELFMNGFMNLVALQAGTSSVTFDKLEIVGSVKEGEDIHVLSRITVGAGEAEITQFEILSFKPYKGTWRLQLNGKMKGIAASIKANLQGA